jgi:nucleoside 2-deoxyribosyltransferase
MKKEKIYFASPFFTPEQTEREERLKRKLRELGYDVWSPKENCVCPPNATEQQRHDVFKQNISGIINSDILFAVTDGKDMGTIWEAGYGYSCCKIVYYCETLGNNQFNLMLAESADVVLTKFEQLDYLEEYLDVGKKYIGDIE